MNLKDKHIVITGAGRGIGAAIVDVLAQQDARISLMGRDLSALAKKGSSLDCDYKAIAVDVACGDSVKTAFAEAREAFGPVDVLINNAGAASSMPFHKLDDNHWQQMITVNLNGVYHCMREAYPDMRSAGWGRIVNIASTAAQRGYPYVAAYSAAKHAVLGLTRSVALECAGKNITVNAVCPGFADTDMTRATLDNIKAATGRSEEEALAALIHNNPQGRLIKPEEVANAVVWLCSHNAAAITGQAISVSGGEVMN